MTDDMQGTASGILRRDFRFTAAAIRAVVVVALLQLVLVGEQRSRCFVTAAAADSTSETDSVTEQCRAAFQSSAIQTTSSMTSSAATVVRWKRTLYVLGSAVYSAWREEDAYSVSVEYCNDTCLYQQYATVGCGVWSGAIWSDCHSVCNETLQDVSYIEIEGCVRGCQSAVDLHTGKLLESLNRWSWSGLVAGSKTNQSLTLQWMVPRGADVIGSPSPDGVVGNASYRIQKQVVGLSPEWINHNAVKWYPRQRVRVSGLQSYVTYKFRMVIVISSSVSYTSSESVPIAMEPYGAPLQPPEIVGTSSSSTSIHLKWKSPFFIGAPLIGYRLTVSSPAAATGGNLPTSAANTRVKEIIVQPSLTASSSVTLDEVFSDVVTMLRPDTEYRITLAALNQYGVGPAAVLTVRTQLFSSTRGQAGYLIVAVDNKIVKQDLANMFSEPEIVYEDPDESILVTAATIHFRRGLVFFSTSRDQIHRVQLSEGVTNGTTTAFRPDASSTSTVVYSAAAGSGTAISGSGLGGGLAVDWLNNRLYFTEDNKVKQCDLDLATCSVAFDHLDPPPEMVNVDPCNGFLYWTQRGSGIYRADLRPTLSSTATAGSITAQRSAPDAASYHRIVRQKNPGPFIVDCVDYRMYYVSDEAAADDDDDASSATLMSADLDGTGSLSVRERSATGESSTSDWTSLTGLARHRPTGSFYWSTAAGRLWAEELDPTVANTGTSPSVYHQNEMPVDGKHFAGVSVWHSTSQPVPVPLSAPTSLQVLFSMDSALASWKEPDFDLGWGAWRRWTYELQLVDNSSSAVISPVSVSCANLTVNNLVPGILYRVRVRACSIGGCGPWSEEFAGQTLKTDPESPYLFYSDSNTIFKTTMNRSNVQSVTDVKLASGVIRELSLFAHVLIIVTENGSVYSTFEGQPLTPLAPVLSGVGLVVFDWLTDTLYWTSKHLNLIQRMTYSKVLAGSSSADLRETVHQSSSSILDLELDSVHGYMYWTTASSVEMARLDGQHHHVLLKLPNFSGRYVLGLTVDVHPGDGDGDGGQLYWLMKDSGDQLSLHTTDLPAGSNDYSGEMTSAASRVLCAFPGRALIPTIEFYSKKMMWLSGQNVMSVLDVTGCSIGHMPLMTTAATSDVSAFTLFHSAKFQYPANFNKSVTVVIPEMVDIENTLSVVGTAEHYTIRWTPATAQHGTVYYRLLLQWGASQRLERQSEEPLLSITGFTKPYSWLHLTVKACTYWGCSSPSHKTFRSPMGAPSVPQRLRAFVTYQRGRRSKRRQQIRVDIRWPRPSEPGGIITAYHVFMTSDLSQEAWNQTSLIGEQLTNKYSLPDVPKNMILYFKVQACTEVACSAFSETVPVNTSVEKPLPRLVTLVNDSIRVLLPADEESRALTVVQASVVALCYIAYDESFYWIDKSGNLMSSSSTGGGGTGAGGLDSGAVTGVGGGVGHGTGSANKTSKTESLGRLKGRGKSIVADWVDRNLYYLEEQNNDVQNAIMKYDLNRKPETSDIVLVRPALILGFIQVSPKQRSLYWTETPTDGKGRLMKCNVDGTKVEPVMLPTRQSQQLQSDSSSPSRTRFRPLRSSPPSEGATNDSSAAFSQCDICPDMAVSPVFALDHTATVDTMTSTSPATTATPSSTTSSSTTITLAAEQQQVVNIYIVDAHSGNIWSLDSNGCRCRLVVNASEVAAKVPNSGLPPDSLTVDQDRLYWTSDAQHVMLSADKRTGLDLVTDQTSSPVKNILAFGDNLQPLPDVQCLKVTSYGRRPSLIASTNSSLTLQLLPWRPAVDCTGDTWRMPVKYTVFYYKQTDNQNLDGHVTLCDRKPAICLSKETYDHAVMLTSLEPYTSYAVQVQATTYYTETPPPIVDSDTIYFRTKPGIPSPVQNVSATTHTPNAVTVKWRPPTEPRGRLEDVVYVIEWNTNNADGSKSEGRSRVSRKVIRSESSSSSTVDKNGLRDTTVHGLKHSHVYLVKVLAYDAEMTGFSASQPVTVRTYQNPYIVELQLPTSTSLQISWMSSIDDSILSHTIEYTEVRENLQWTPLGPQVNTTNATLYYRAIEGLRPNTGYAVRVNFFYRSGYPSKWPTLTQATFFTLADVPAKPELVWISDTVDGNLMVRWKAPYDSGSPIQHYQLDCRLSDHDNWTTVYNGTETEWLISDDDILNERSYRFRVAAKNLIGWGPYSNGSHPLALLPRTVRKPDHPSIELVLPLSILLLLTIVVFGIVFITCRRRAEGKQVVKSSSTITVGGIIRSNTDHELAILRELPASTVQTSNALYTINNSVPTAEEVASLRHFHRDQIKLTMFLGSGAFGEVFEGLALDVSGDERQCTKVAVKTLHKNASEFEKEEFLKEALLMSNFKHEHILQMLGVCLNNDPQFIILELMEGGDLLSFLRSSRPTVVSEYETIPQSLSLPDMISICFDICKGCEYLEDLHFVHRDLAARNCLISTTDGNHVVKIGDFGLARDIYKNDYYRKEGECLLPVRWMSPESLIDGVFTTQSDVWAYGVLIWEVLTLGQQPYPARTNTEVLHFVRSGGRLDRPDNCPDDLYHLMLKCWLYVPHTRPSFKYLVQQISGFMQRANDPMDDFSGRRDHLRGQTFRPRMAHMRHAIECPTTSDDSGNDSATHRERERHLTVSSRKSMPTGIGRRSRAVPVSRRRPMSDPNSSAVRAASAAAYHREAGYLQPLIVSATGADCHSKYLELLNVPPTPASRHQVIGSLAAARMARAGGDSPALPTRSQYSALVSDDSPGTSLLTGLERCWKDDADDSESADETRNSPRTNVSASGRLGSSAPCGGYSTWAAERQPSAPQPNDNRIYNVGLRLSSAGVSATSDRHLGEAGNGNGLATASGASQADISPLLPVRHGLSQLNRD